VGFLHWRNIYKMWTSFRERRDFQDKASFVPRPLRQPGPSSVTVRCGSTFVEARVLLPRTYSLGHLVGTLAYTRAQR